MSPLLPLSLSFWDSVSFIQAFKPPSHVLSFILHPNASILLMPSLSDPASFLFCSSCSVQALHSYSHLLFSACPAPSHILGFPDDLLFLAPSLVLFLSHHIWPSSFLLSSPFYFPWHWFPICSPTEANRVSQSQPSFVGAWWWHHCWAPEVERWISSQLLKTQCDAMAVESSTGSQKSILYMVSSEIFLCPLFRSCIIPSIQQLLYMTQGPINGE